MFEFLFMLLGLILVYYTVNTFERFTPKVSVILIPLYTILVFLVMIFEWQISIPLKIIISVVMIIAAFNSIIIGLGAFTLSETNEEKTKKVIKRQKLGEGFGITIFFTSVIVLIKVIINLFQILIPFFLKKGYSVELIVFSVLVILYFFACGQEGGEEESCDACP